MYTKALVIAVSYTGTENALRGCDTDGERIYAYLQRCSPQCEIRVLCDDHGLSMPIYGVPTDKEILAQIDWLVQGATPASHLWISYSGHGGLHSAAGNRCFMPTPRAHMSVPHRISAPIPAHAVVIAPVVAPTLVAEDAETILGCDFQRYGDIDDVALRRRLVDALPDGATLTAFFDSCHSGTVLNLRHEWVDGDAKSDTASCIGKAVSKHGESKAHVLLVSGCRDNQTSADAFIDNHYCGATTTSFLACLAALDTLDTLEKFLHGMNRWMVDNNFAQRPEMSLGRQDSDIRMFLSK